MVAKTLSSSSNRSRTRARTKTRTRTKGPAQRLGRVSGGLMAMGGIFVGAVLAPSHFTALLFMSFFILIGGYVMDKMSMAKWLPARLVGPAMALAGMLMVIWLISNGRI